VSDIQYIHLGCIIYHSVCDIDLQPPRIYYIPALNRRDEGRGSVRRDLSTCNSDYGERIREDKTARPEGIPACFPFRCKQVRNRVSTLLFPSYDRPDSALRAPLPLLEQKVVRGTRLTDATWMFSTKNGETRCNL